MADLETLFGLDTQSPDPTPPEEAPVEAPSTPAPQPTSTASPPSGGQSLQELFGIPEQAPTPAPTPAPAPAQEAAPAPVAGAPAAPDTSSFLEAFGRGAFQGGVKQNLSSLADAAEMYAAMGDSETAQKISDYLNSVNKNLDSLKVKDFQVPSLSDILGSSVGDTLARAKTYVGEQLGSGFGSSGPSLIGGTAAAAATGETGPLALVVGFGTAGAISYLQNAPQVYRGLIDAGMTDKAQAAKIALVAGAPMAALDTIGEHIPLLKGIGVEGTQLIKRAVFKRIAEDAARGATFEGTTEAMQQVIQDATTSLATGKDFWTMDNLKGWADNFAGGAISGGALAGASAVKPDVIKHDEPPLPGSDTTTSTPAQPEGTQAPADHLGGDVTSTPGGIGTSPPSPHYDPATDSEADNVSDYPEETDDDENQVDTGRVDAAQELALGTGQPLASAGTAIDPTAIPTATAPAQTSPVSDDLGAAFEALAGQHNANHDQNTVDQILAAVTPPAPQTGAPTGAVTPQVEQSPVLPAAQATNDVAPVPDESAGQVVAPPGQVGAEPVQAEAPMEEAPPSAPAPVEAEAPALEQPAPVEPTALAGETVEAPPAELSVAEPGDAFDVGTELTPAPQAALTQLNEGRVNDVRRMIEPEALEAARAELPNDADHPQAMRATAAAVHAAVNTAFHEHADMMGATTFTDANGKERKISVGETFRALRQKIVDRAREIAATHREGIREGAAVQQVRELQKAEEIEKARNVERQGKNKGKSEEGIAKQSETTFQRHHAAQGDSNPRSKEVNRLYKQLSELKAGSGKLRTADRKLINEKLEAIRSQERAEARTAADAKKEAPEVTKARNDREVAATKRNLGLTEEERENARRDAADAKHRAAHAEHDKILARTLTDIPEVSNQALKGNAAQQTALLFKRLANVRAELLKRLGYGKDKQLPAKLSLAHSKATNYLIQAKRILDSRETPGQDRLHNLLALTIELEHSKSPRDFYDQLEKADKDFQTNLDQDAVDNAPHIEPFTRSEEAAQEDQFDAQGWDTAGDMTGSPNRAVGQVTNHGLKTYFGEVNNIPNEDVTSVNKILDRPGNHEASKRHKFANTTRRVFQGPDGLYRWMSRWLEKRYRAQLGDMPVYTLDEADMSRVGKTRSNAFYLEPTTADRANGAKGAIVMRRGIADGDPDYLQAVIRHELGHALTVYAIRSNIDGARDILVHMANRLRSDLLREGRSHVYNDPSHPEFQYGLSHADRSPMIDAAEFAAEAMNHAGFQEFLASRELPPSLRKLMGDHKLNGREKISNWDLFLSTVQKILGMTGFGRNGMSYLENIIRLQEPSLRGGAYVQEHAAGVIAGRNPTDMSAEDIEKSLNFKNSFQLKGPTGAWGLPGVEHHVFEDRHFGSAQVNQTTVNAYNATSRMLENYFGLGTRFRKHLLRLQTLSNIAQNMERYLGRDAASNGFHRILDAVRSKAVAAKNMMQTGDELVANMNSLPRHQRDELSALMHDATIHNVDPSQSIKGPNNKWIGTGTLNAVNREAHTRLKAEFDKLTPQQQSLFVRGGKYYADTQNKVVRSQLDTILNEARAADQRAGPGKQPIMGQLPAGKTLKDQTDWILNGGLERMGTQRQTDADVDMQASLGAIAGRIRDITSLRHVKGFYVPLVRKGQYFVSAKRKMVVPAGATAIGQNQFMFRADRKGGSSALDKWAKTNTDHLARRIQSIWMMKNPATGKVERVSPEEVLVDKNGDAHFPVQHFVVTPQLEQFERHETEVDAKARVRELAADEGYHSVKNHGLGKDNTKGNDYDFIPSQIRDLIDAATRHIQDQDVRNTVTRSLAGQIMQMNTGTRISDRQRRRRGVHGYATDQLDAMRSYNVSTAHHMAQLATRPEVNEGFRQIEASIRQHQDREFTKDEDSAIRIQEALGAVKENLAKNEVYNPASPGSKAIQTGLSLSFLNHLFSPANWVLNSLQPGMVTLPYLGGKHGFWRAHQSLGRAYRLMGVGNQLVTGFKNVFRPRKPHESVKPIIEHFKALGMHDEAAMLEELRRQDLLGNDAGFELEANELNKSIAGRTMGRISAVASAIPKAMENINRATTGLSAYWLARQDGKSHLAAIDAAKDAVNDTQGDYQQAVAPYYLKSPGARLFFQFKKFPQMMMRLLLKTASDALRGETPEIRRKGAKQLLGLTLTHMLIAGAAGAPFMEGLKLLALLAHGMGADNDWEDWTNEVQGLIAQFTGSAGLSEAIVRGLPRLIGIDMSGRTGLDSLLFFGSPHDNQNHQLDAEGVQSWLFQTLAGAPLGLLTSTLEGLSSVAQGGDWEKAAQKAPIPKILDDIWKAGDAYFGTPTKLSGAPDPNAKLNVREAVWKSLGFQPARIAERYEYGGDRYAQNKIGERKQERVDMVSKFLNAQTPNDRAAVWKQIQTENHGKKAADRITYDQLMKAKERRKTTTKSDAKAQAKEIAR